MLSLPPLEESFPLSLVSSLLLPSCPSGIREGSGIARWDWPSGPSHPMVTSVLVQGTVPGVWGGLSPPHSVPIILKHGHLTLIAFVRAGPVSTNEPDVWRRSPTPFGWDGTRDSWVGRKVDAGMGTEKNTGLREFPH